MLLSKIVDRAGTYGLVVTYYSPPGVPLHLVVMVELYGFFKYFEEGVLYL